MSIEYKLVSRQNHVQDSIIRIGENIFGGENFVIIAGPCAVESEAQINETAEFLSTAGIRMMRGGAFKPRTSPYSFQGLGLKGLQLLAGAGERYGLSIVTEAMDIVAIEQVAEYADMIQIGSRNMQNFPLLKAAGKINRPVLLKRGLSATIDELLLAAEYIFDAGNEQVILCERGVRGFNDHTRNMLDISAIPILQKLSHLPVIADPSHASGRSDLVVPLSRAAVAIGAHGLMIEVHPNPQAALSDSAQSLDFSEFQNLIKEIEPFLPTSGSSHD